MLGSIRFKSGINGHYIPTIYVRNVPVKPRSIPPLEELMGQVIFSIGEVMQFLAVNDFMTIPESCEKCGCVNSISWKN